MELEIRAPRSPEEFERYYDLRWRILREPWTQERESGRDALEGDAFHLTAWDEDRLVGAGRLHSNSPDEAQVRYMAVEEGFAARGIGGAILRALEEEAHRRGAKWIVLNARESAVAFYRKHGYILVSQAGTVFMSMTHWLMRKELRADPRDVAIDSADASQGRLSI